MKQRIGAFCIRLASILLVTALLLWLPDIQNGSILQMKNVLVSLLSVIMIGVSLYDTFFYNRSRW